MRDHDAPWDGEDEEGRWDGKRLERAGERLGHQRGFGGRSERGSSFGSKLALLASLSRSSGVDPRPEHNAGASPTFQLQRAGEGERRGTHSRLLLKPADEKGEPAESDEHDSREDDRPGRHLQESRRYDVLDVCEQVRRRRVDVGSRSIGGTDDAKRIIPLEPTELRSLCLGATLALQISLCSSLPPIRASSSEQPRCARARRGRTGIKRVNC